MLYHSRVLHLQFEEKMSDICQKIIVRNFLSEVYRPKIISRFSKVPKSFRAYKGIFN